MQQTLTPQASMLIGGRTLCSVGVTWCVVAGSVWVSESTPAAVRGSIMTCISFGWTTGTLAVYALGDKLLWRPLSLAAVATAVLTFFVAACSFVESPRWLAANKGMAEAEKALHALRTG